MQLKTVAPVIAGRRIETEQLGDLIRHFQSGEPADEFLHGEDVRRKHGDVAIAFQKILLYFPPGAAVRQNDGGVMHRYIGGQNLVYKLCEKRNHNHYIIGRKCTQKNKIQRSALSTFFVLLRHCFTKI